LIPYLVAFDWRSQTRTLDETGGRVCEGTTPRPGRLSLGLLPLA
jgi:hypothetical protein